MTRTSRLRQLDTDLWVADAPLRFFGAARLAVAGADQQERSAMRP